MALVHEDGSVVPGAESYVSLSDADAYHTARSRTDWAAASAAVREAALRKATDEVDARFAGRWLGRIQTESQSLSWPRAEAFDAEGRKLSGVPAPLKAAVCELAYASLSSGGSDAAPVIEKTEKVGPISTTVKYAEGTVVTPPSQTQALRLLSGLLVGGGTVRVVRT